MAGDTTQEPRGQGPSDTARIRSDAAETQSDDARGQPGDSAPRSDGAPSQPAGLLRRLGALVYDLLLLLSVLIAYTLAVLLVRRGEAVPPGTWWFELSLATICVAFFTGFWTHGGQTLGMLAFRLRLVAADGGAVSWPAALLRAAASLVSVLPAGLGFWWALVDPERRCWHDLLSGTRIIRLCPSRPGAVRKSDSDG